MPASIPYRSPEQHIRQHDLALRWGISPRTLERWRWLGQGPQYLKIGSRVAYRMEDVLAYETARRRSTQEQGEPPPLPEAVRLSRGTPE
ncbi:helix-turn-helix transcriptional regulator [Teichococcus vastitatis]|uniref:Helix-turn-helix domain-containing protein n=1 Tax=Teichococcus vastitatis TaxID=2307076 RepID=A0ABS9W2M9_9PROT|nr:helix-turn-helix domain-containing protein [Pseudoroseomonas vastitatis]MCI0753556.1 helix-turn-helix domain-containing protein [Pseudoroseomonas vastitatis]